MILKTSVLTVFKFLLRCGKKAGRFWKPLFNHLIQVHVGLKTFFKFGRQMFEKNKVFKFGPY